MSEEKEAEGQASAADLEAAKRNEERRNRDWRVDGWTGFNDFKVSLKSDDDILNLMEFATQALMKKKAPVTLVKVVSYVAQTAHKILADTQDLDSVKERIEELERAAGIAVKINRAKTKRGTIELTT